MSRRHSSIVCFFFGLTGKEIVTAGERIMKICANRALSSFSGLWMVCRNRKLDTSHLCASTVGNNQVWMTPRSQLPLVLLCEFSRLFSSVYKFIINH